MTTNKIKISLIQKFYNHQLVCSKNFAEDMLNDLRKRKRAEIIRIRSIRICGKFITPQWIRRQW